MEKNAVGNLPVTKARNSENISQAASRKETFASGGYTKYKTSSAAAEAEGAKSESAERCRTTNWRVSKILQGKKDRKEKNSKVHEQRLFVRWIT